MQSVVPGLCVSYTVAVGAAMPSILGCDAAVLISIAAVQQLRQQAVSTRVIAVNCLGTAAGSNLM